ncbi:MAG: PhnD/SsuA/transferrin family substrate-binding protein [Rhodospirillales bacterium]|nr:PhnD/SsuA/transferrin family substrate-binding protein [Rhodospirillales bacterium]MDP6773265.1 PhnD/SsuA/transferrin family substrate-binding protein [Rhodospirillales bacterium]
MADNESLESGSRETPRPAPHASLPLYALPENAPARNAFWQAVRTEVGRQGIGDMPGELDLKRPTVPERIEPEMRFSQICGYPLCKMFHGQATILGAPVYDDEHCDGPTHSGAFVVHRDAPYRALEDLRGCRFGAIAHHSNSAMNLPRRAIADIAGGAPFFGSIAEGSPAQSGNLVKVAEKEVDATCVDNMTFSFFAQSRPETARSLRILAVTPPSPSIPFVTSRATDADTTGALRRALRRVGSAPEWAEVRAAMLLKDIVEIDDGAYGKLLDYEREAAERGYPELR